MSVETHSSEDTAPGDALRRVDEAVCAFDDEWQFTFINAKAATMLEREPAALLGEELWESLPDIEDTIVGDKLREAMDTQESIRFDRYNESLERWFKIRLYPSGDGITGCFYDITDERGEQLDLQRQRRLFETVFEETEDALVVADTDRRITDFNPAAEQLFGYDAEDVVGEKSRLLYADETAYDRQGTERFNHDSPERSETYVVEYERADGTTFEGETMGTSLKGADGETLVFLGSIRDVSSRVEYQQTVEARNDALRSFHEIATDEERSFDEQMQALLELGTDQLELDVGSMARIDGETYTIEHAVSPADTLGARTRGLDQTYCERVVENGELVAIPDTRDTRDERTDGEGRWQSYIGAPIVVGGELYGTLRFSSTEPRTQPFTEGKETFVRLLAQWIGKEVSRQRNSERAAANRDRLRQIVDMLPQLVFAKDRDGEFLLANEAVAAAYGTTVDKLEGATDADFLDSAEAVEQFRGDDLAVIDAGEPEEIEESLTTADGETLRLQTTKIPYDPVDHETDAVLGVATDITALRERDEEIELQSEAMEVAMDGIAILDDGEYVYTNESHAAIFGFEPEELLGSDWRRLYGPEETERLETDVFPVLTEDGEWRGETVGHTRDGDQVHQEITFSLLEDGKLICTNRDITERKEKERELERSRDFIEKAQESAAIGGWEVDLQAGTLRWTDEVYRIHDLPTDTDVTPEEGIDFYHPEDRQTIQDAFERLTTDGKPYDLELRLVTANDRIRWVRTVGDPVRENGEIVGALGIFQDITERKEREQELREVNERLDLAVEGGNIGIWDWNMQTDAVTFNEQWAEMLDLSLAELDSTLETWQDRVHPADMSHVEEQLQAHIAGETDLYDCEHRMQTKSGDWRWIRDVGKVVEHEDGDPARAVGIHLDITDQKESALYLEEERDMFAQGPAIVFKWQNDEGWPVEYVSENVAGTFGYTPEQLTSGEVPYTELVHDDDLDRVAREVEAQSDETTQRFSHDPYRMVTDAGEIRWVTDNTKIIRNDGEITHYLGYLIDITEQKRLEQSLRESEQSLRELTDVASEANQSFEEKLTVLLELGRERLGLPYGFLNRMDGETQHVVQAVGDHPELQSGATAPKSESYCRKTMARDDGLDIQDATAEGWAGDPAYERFDLGCYIGGTVVVDGEQYGTLCFADQTARDHEFDDTERAFVELLVQWLAYELTSNSFETKLREINETAQELVTAASRSAVAAITTSSAKSVLDMQMTGVWLYDEEVDALVPERQTEEAADVVDDQPRFEQGDSLAWEAFAAGEMRVFDDLQSVPGRYNESTGLRSEVIVPLGEYGVVIASATEPRAFSETDLNLLEVLSSTVEAALTRTEREEVLRETQRQLEQSNEELEQFAYAASHDLQEPLRTVSSYLTLLERRYSDQLDEDALEFIEFAVDGADRMREMIQALLTYSRVDTHGEGFADVPAETLFEHVTRNLEVTIEETDATVSTPATDVAVLGDESQLVQLFQNLVENGIKYNEGTPRVDISVTSHDGMVQFEVTDDGIGIADDQTDEIFEVFQRLHTREEFDGTGIGLSVCRKIAERHDGTIRVDSEPGEGSTFVVRLPAGESDV